MCLVSHFIVIDMGKKGALRPARGEAIMRLIKKKMVLEAYQWTPDLADKTPNYYRDKKGWWIVIEERKRRISRGDWIVTGVTGEQYIAKKPD